MGKKGDKGGIRNFYLDFGKALAAVVPGLTIDQLRAGLKNYDSDMLDKFRLAFKEMMGGVEFQARAGNLIPILRKLVKSKAFKERFKGLAIFFDEFGFTLEKAGYSKDILQGFMETICKSEPNVFFVGCIHKDFKSYADFIENAEVTLSDGKLNLYTVDQLFTFFSKELSQKNPELRDRQRQFVNGYYASVDALRKATEGELFGFQEDERIEVLRTILIYQLCQIPTSLENIQFGLYCLSNSEKNQIKGYLKDLVKNGAVFFRQQSKTYELAASTGEDPYDLIERFVADPNLHPSDMVAAFLEESAGKHLSEYAEAKGYNLPFGEDKRFHTRFVRTKDLGDALLDEIRKNYTENRNKPAKSFEGTLVYVLCEDDSEINVAREVAKTVTDENVALAVPHAPPAFYGDATQSESMPPLPAAKRSRENQRPDRVAAA